MDGRESMTMPSQFYVQYRNFGNGMVSGQQQMVPNPFIGRAGQSFTVIGSPEASPAEAASGGTPGKRKRGRPRKYGPEGSAAAVGEGAMPSLEAGAEAAALAEGEGSAPPKRGRGRPPGSGRKQQLAALGGWIANSAGTGFTPHTITIAEGEVSPHIIRGVHIRSITEVKDITAKIMSFSEQGPRVVCILSANGSVSTVTLRQPPSGDTITYEGCFNILSMSGSYLPTDDNGSHTRSGGINISLSGSDGRVIGGAVGGVLVAASSVQIVVGSFIHGGSKTKKKTENVQEAAESESPAVVETSTQPAYVPGGWPAFDQADTQNSYEE